MNIRTLKALGFDQSKRSGRYLSVRCSQCMPAVVNGHPLHEKGCPNEQRECKGCFAMVSTNQRYCTDCQE